MSINFSLGSPSLTQVDNLTDLKNTVATYLKIGKELEGKHDFTLASLPVELRTTSIGYTSGNQCWKLGDFGFTLSGGVCGKLSVTMAGDELFKYANGFETKIAIGLDTSKADDCNKSVKVPAGAAYVCIELDFQIDGGISASYTQGVYGVSGSVNSTDTFSVAFYKKCSPSDKLGPAIASAFSDMVLPLHAQTLSNLKVGDYLHHTFNGNLQLGLGALDRGGQGSLCRAVHSRAFPTQGARLAWNFRSSFGVSGRRKAGFSNSNTTAHSKPCCGRTLPAPDTCSCIVPRSRTRVSPRPPASP